MKLFRRVVPDPAARALLAFTAAACIFVITSWTAFELVADIFCIGGTFKGDWCPDHPWVMPMLVWSAIGAVGLLGICTVLGIALVPLLLARLARAAGRRTPEQ